MEPGATAGVVGGGDGAAVTFDDSLTDRQAQTGAGVPDVGALEGSEHLLVPACRNADATVDDLEVDPVVRLLTGTYLDVGELARQLVLQGVAR